MEKANNNDSTKNKKELTEARFDVRGMTCAACQNHVEKAVSKVKGVSQVDVNLMTNQMKVTFDQDNSNSQEIISAVQAAGYDAIEKRKDNAQKENFASSQPSSMQKEAKHLKRRLISSIIFIIPLMYISMGKMLGAPQPAFLSGLAGVVNNALLQMLLTIVVIYINREFYISGFKSLWNKSPNMDALVAIGSASSLIYGIVVIFQMVAALSAAKTKAVFELQHNLYFESAAMILTLITVGKYLEARSKAKTGDAVRELMDLAPDVAIVERNGKTEEIPTEQVRPGDVVQIKPGSSIPVDGVIISGHSAVDESALTGESLPVDKKEHDRVTGGTVNRQGFLRVKADNVGQDSTLAKIVQLVEDASGSKAPVASMADKIAAIFVPVVIIIAIVTFIVWLASGSDFSFAFSMGITVLVISCPCALGLATPMALMVASGKAAKNGILIKSGEALELAAETKSILLDKTGTITAGEPKVRAVFVNDPDAKESEIKDYLITLAAVEEQSEHPLAKAVVSFVRNRYPQTPFPQVRDFHSVTGRGVKANLGSKHYLIGSARMLKEESKYPIEDEMQSWLDKYESLGHTVVFALEDGKAKVALAIADVIKENSALAISDLKKMQREVIMLTGDRKKTAASIATESGVSSFKAELLPDDKEGIIRDLQSKDKRVMMVGDGINDAPALARADVGVAIGAGTDIAMETADIVLMHSDLNDVTTTIELSQATLKNIKQNLFWAFIYNIIGIPLAAGVLYPAFGISLNPIFAAAAMSLSSLFVVTNSLRLRRFKAKNKSDYKMLKNDCQVNNCKIMAANDTNVNIDIASDKVKTDLKTTDKNKGEKTMKEQKIIVDGMSCEHCKMAVERALEGIDEVKEAKVNLETKTASIKSDVEIPEETLKQVIAEAGYELVSVK